MSSIARNSITEDEQILIEDFARLAPGIASDGESEASGAPVRRASRASFNFFQRETSKQYGFDLPVATTKQAGRRNSFIGQDGKIQDDYIQKRVSLNKPTTLLKDKVPMLVDLAEADTITRVDGNVLGQMFVSAYVKLSGNVNYLNKINVFPIADGDTGANMKVCLKLPSRNLLLDPSPSILRVASNMAADVLLNGQGNSGTILSHFFVSLAEEIRDFPSSTYCDSLSTDEFASCLAATGRKMSEAVLNPVEGTLLSVARDSCLRLMDENDKGDEKKVENETKKYANLKELLKRWNELAQLELQKTPDQLIVDGVKVLEKAGVVDSGAQGFVYAIEGMCLASNGQLPEALNPALFETAVKRDGESDFATIVDDHNVCDTKYQFCTEAVVLLKDGVTKDQVMKVIIKECGDSDGSCCNCGGHSEPLGDSVVCVSAPAKEGGNMLKLHIHTNEPEVFFDKLKPFSRDHILKKEKVEDMKIMREVEHESVPDGSQKDSKFTILGLSYMCLPPNVSAANKDILDTFPMFMVPGDTNEPMDLRYVTETETLIALNRQRDPSTAIRYTTATSSPMQMKIELLAALTKGKPILCFVLSTDKKMSAFGRNVLLAVDMLDPEEKKMIHIFVHGWGNDGPFILEAIKYARAGKTLEEAAAACEDIAQRSFGRVGFMNSAAFAALKAWRPTLFPDGFQVPPGHHFISGPPAKIRPDGIPLPKRLQLLFAPVGMGSSMEDAFEEAAKHIKEGLEPKQKVGNIMVPCIGRPDYGHLLVQKMVEAGIEIDGTPYVYNEGLIGAVMGAWGSVSLMYNIVEE
eukprot:jgi/Psemu1/291526/fgenesh1_pg.727_\